jgi:ribose-phosphate pyrophosphokinase
MRLVALPGGERLAQALARELSCAWSPLAVHRFPDGECLVRFDTPVRGEQVVLAGSLDQPDGKTLPLLFAADAARELGAAEVGLVAPYLAYMRQDERFQPGEAITSRSYARLLSASLDWLLTVDPHLHRWRSLDQIYSIPTQVLPAAPAIAAWLRDNVPAPLLVGPDSESSQWVAETARLADAPWLVMDKVRRGDHDVTVRLPDHGLPASRTPVLMDDILSTGRTALAACEALLKAGTVAPVCVAVHALLDAGAVQRLLKAGVQRVVSTDTIAHPTNAIALAPLLAEALRARELDA